MAGNNIHTLTDATFDADVLKSPIPVLVDFWAEWCGPCRQIASAVDAIATEYDGRVKVGKLNVDDNQATALRYNVRGIPTLLLFKGGAVAEQIVGLVSKDRVASMINKHLG